ncbi:MAG: beta-lactamase family protein [Acidobacteria bacterium]|nr:beta-lactamase family protein [Acidobacteriota bacterium]
MKNLIVLLMAALILASGCVAQNARLDRVMQEFIDQEKVAGAVALVLKDGKPIYEKAFGWSDREAKRPMKVDSLFRIASQTKALTSAAILALVEDGKIGINEPVGNFIGSFKKTSVALKDGTILPATRPITIAHLLTHTAGISYGREPQISAKYVEKGLGAAAGFGWYTADKNEGVCATMERLGTLPFVEQPGEVYVYGYNTDILGCVVEKASGMSLDAFLKARITGPLGLKDTRFYVPASEKERLATVYMTGANGKVERAPEGAQGQGHYVEGPRVSFSGGAGLTSTARDYARFLETIRRGGELDGVRVLGSRAVGLMTTNQTGLLHSKAGLGFGFGFQTVDRYGADGMAGVGAFGWGGAYGTKYQVDPKSGMVVVLMIQMLPNGTDIQQKFMTSVYQAVVE